MSNAITITDVRRQAAIVGELARQARILDESEYPVLSEGSKYYGNAYRLNFTPRGASYHARITRLDDFLGMTKREAWQTLHNHRAIVEAFADGAGIELDWNAAHDAADRAEKSKRVDWSLWSDVAPWKDAVACK